MKKYVAILIVFCMFILTGCETGTGRIFYPSGDAAELYYNTFPDVKNVIKREDVKRGNHYNDLFLAKNVKSGMTLEDVLYEETREALLDVSTGEEVFFMPASTAETALSTWINQSTLKYTFDHNGRVLTYEVVNSKSNNTYKEYLFVMRALHLKYGECTTEMYKNDDNIIDNSKVKEDYKLIDELVEFYDSEFQNGNVQIISEWINDGYNIIVSFAAGSPCSVVYEFSPEEVPESDE